MKISKYRIRNYKGILDTSIKLNYSINPIIGVNESGKTSILQAILAFDKNRDKVNAGMHLDFQNKYSTKITKDSKISAYIKLEKFEIKELKQELQFKTGSEDYKIFEQLGENYEFILTRILSEENSDYKIENSNFSKKANGRIKNYFLKKLPIILYFDDFTDRVPDNISFKDDYKDTGKLVFSRNKEWQEIIVEIFRRADVEGINDGQNPLQSFFILTDEDRKKDMLSDIEDVLNKEIINEWKRIKKSGHKNFADDSDNLSLQLNLKDQTFVFKVIDKSNQDKKRTFNIFERSKGFQWFFNYMVKLKFNPRYKGSKENSIFLLDEPGSYLHSSAQSELLEELKTVSRDNIIVYCTHSQYLLNPKTIKLGSIKIAEKKNSVIELIDYGNYKGKDDTGALSAVYQALKLNFTQDFIGKIIITEGITDWYFFQMLCSHTKLIKSKFKIIPGSGSGNSSNLISIGLSFSENFIVLFDNDSGANAIKKYVKEFGEEINKHFKLYDDNRKFALEDFLSKTDKEKLLFITKANQIKKGLAILYYDVDSKEKQKYFNEFDSETLKNLSSTIDNINNI